MIKILVVDDSALVRKLLGQVLAGEADFEVRFARNGLEALDQLKQFGPDVITLDVQMPQMDGLTCLDRIMLERPCPVVMVSSLTAEGADTTLQALHLGAVDFIPKPEGAVTLHKETWAPGLVAKVRAAAGARLRPSMRLKDRVRHQLGPRGAASQQRPAFGFCDLKAATGEGLVLVGVSTGGPPALEILLTALPRSFPWPILIAQHMPATFTGPLARRLDALCEIGVREVLGTTLLEAGVAYIGRGDADIVVSRRPAGLVAMAAPAKPDYPWHPSTDRLVRTAMEQLPTAQLIGVLMTGMGNDGASAMAELRTRGGRTIAEAEESAVVWGMPGELVKLDGADFILPLAKIAGQLETLTP